MQKDLREANVRFVRVETERNDADKEARRFGAELKKSRLAEQEAITKLQDMSKLYKAEKSLRMREQRARRSGSRNGAAGWKGQWAQTGRGPRIQLKYAQGRRDSGRLGAAGTSPRWYLAPHG